VYLLPGTEHVAQIEAGQVLDRKELTDSRKGCEDQDDNHECQHNRHQEAPECHEDTLSCHFIKVYKVSPSILRSSPKLLAIPYDFSAG